MSSKATHPDHLTNYPKGLVTSDTPMCKQCWTHQRASIAGGHNSLLPNLQLHFSRTNTSFVNVFHSPQHHTSEQCQAENSATIVVPVRLPCAESNGPAAWLFAAPLDGVGHIKIARLPSEPLTSLECQHCLSQWFLSSWWWHCASGSRFLHCGSSTSRDCCQWMLWAQLGFAWNCAARSPSNKSNHLPVTSSSFQVSTRNPNSTIASTVIPNLLVQGFPNAIYSTVLDHHLLKGGCENEGWLSGSRARKIQLSVTQDFVWPANSTSQLGQLSVLFYSLFFNFQQ